MAPPQKKAASSIQRQSIGVGSLDHVSEFAERILCRMQELGLKQKDLVELTDLSRQTLHSVLRMGLEGDTTMPKIGTILRLARALHVHPYWLVEGLFANVALPPSVKEQADGDRAAFVVDVNYPDGTWVAPGVRFTKTWRVQNLGPDAWQKGSRKLVCWDDEVIVTSKRTGQALHVAGRLVPDELEVHLSGDLDVGGVVDLSMTFTAPKTSGTVISCWMPVFADGGMCWEDESSMLWVSVHVTTLADMVAFKQRKSAG
jgi:transcriptional regulator with XRE-family HTH domain